MKKLLKFLLYSILFLVIVIFVYGWKNYAPDKSLEELKASWAYDNSQFLELRGIPVHYRINGEGDPLVLIHGTGASLHTWEEWTKILEKDFKVISLDMPAFGLTGPNPERVYSLEFYADFLNEFLGKIGVENCALAGNSLGGAIAWRFSTMFPEKINSLILVDAGGYPSDKDPPLAFQLAQNKLLSNFLLTVTPKSLFKKSLKDVYHNKALATEKLIDRYYDLYLREGNRQAFVDRVNSIHYVDPSEIKNVKAPTLIMWGKTDAWIPVENAYKFEKDIKGSVLKIYENAGHVPMEELPNETAMDAKAFLTTIKEKINSQLEVVN